MQADRQIDRHLGRQTNRHTYRHTDRNTLHAYQSRRNEILLYVSNQAYSSYYWPAYT